MAVNKSVVRVRRAYLALSPVPFRVRVISEEMLNPATDKII